MGQRGNNVQGNEPTAAQGQLEANVQNTNTPAQAEQSARGVVNNANNYAVSIG